MAVFVILVVIAVEGVSLGWVGERAARRDLAEGRCVLTVRGAFCLDGVRAVMRERYGVELNPVDGGCMQTRASRSYKEGYARVMQAELDAMFGAGAVRKLSREVETEFEAEVQRLR